MNKQKYFEESLPENYVLVKHVDAKNINKQTVVYTILSIIPLLILLPILFAVAYSVSNYDILDRWNADFGMLALLLTCAVLFLYILLHELTHGITYKIFTGAKLTFGLTLTVAFCGVPNIYVRKKASVASLIMPFLIFSVLFVCLTIVLWPISPLYGICSGVVLAMHLGGCVGDLHWTMLYLTKYRHCNTLMRDTGPEQWLYIPKSESEQYKIACIAPNDAENAQQGH